MTSLVWIAFAAMVAESPPASDPGFFPIDETGAAGVSKLEAGWYGKALGRMGEPSLRAAAKGARVIRFTLLPTWGRPVAVRLTVSKDAATIDAKRLDGAGGYDPGKLAESTTRTLSAADTKELLALFAKLDVAKAPTREPNVGGRDGSQWILEAVEDGKYHVVVRWSPKYPQRPERVRALADFTAVCEWLYRASRLDGDVTNKKSVEIERDPGR